MKKLIKLFVAVYLRLVVKLLLFRNRSYIVAITGITNKSTTRKAVVNALNGRIKQSIGTTTKGYNTEVGLPLALLNIELNDQKLFTWIKIVLVAFVKAVILKLPDILVLEFGVSEKNDIKKLLKIVKPDIGIITNIGFSDINPQTSINEILDEMKIFVKALPKNGLTILNADSLEWALLAQVSKARVVLYGLSDNANVQGSNLLIDTTGTHWAIDGYKFDTNSIGRHHLYAGLAAEAVYRFIKDYEI